MKIAMSTARVGLALVVGVAAFALGALGARAAGPPALYVTYDANGNLSVSVADGVPLGSSATIAPGPYWVTFDDEFSSERIVHKWHLTGPGVDISTMGADLNCDSSIEQYLGVLQPNSTYTIQDDLHSAVRPVVFRTAAAGAGASGQAGASPAAHPGSNVHNSDIAGSGVPAYRGALVASVSAAGTLSLDRNGKPVRSGALKAGRYTIALADRSARVGFRLARVDPPKRTLVLTSAAFVGKRSVTVQLDAGGWAFLSRSGSPTRSFVVARA
jgi:hypothetical protein